MEPQRFRTLGKEKNMAVLFLETLKPETEFKL